MAKDELQKVSVEPEVKRQIAVAAGTEGRFEYEIVADAMKLYRSVAAKPVVTVKRGTKGTRTIQPVSEVIATH